MILPRQVRSGLIPVMVWYPPKQNLKPVITSSKMSRDPQARVFVLMVSRNPALGRTTPMFPATGSTMTAATSDPRCSMNASKRAASL